MMWIYCDVKPQLRNMIIYGLFWNVDTPSGTSSVADTDLTTQVNTMSCYKN